MFNCLNSINNKNECPCNRSECESYWNILVKEKSNKNIHLHHCDFIKNNKGEKCHRITTDLTIYRCVYCKHTYCINHVSIQHFKQFKKPNFFCDKCIVDNNFTNI